MAQSYNSSINQEFSVAELALKLYINHHYQKFLEKSNFNHRANRTQDRSIKRKLDESNQNLIYLFASLISLRREINLI